MFLRENDPSGAGSVSLSYGPTDLDRICGLGYGTATAPQAPACNVSYDGAGNTLSMPTRAGSTRTFSFFPNGAVSGIADGASNASFAYDAFGGLQQLTINTPSADQRADKRFGRFIKQRIEGSQSVIDRANSVAWWKSSPRGMGRAAGPLRSAISAARAS